jgi:phage-related minor tail protein
VGRFAVHLVHPCIRNRDWIKTRREITFGFRIVFRMDLTNCVRCRSRIPKDSRICPVCAADQETGISPIPDPPPDPQRRRAALGWAWIVAGCGVWCGFPLPLAFALGMSSPGPDEFNATASVLAPFVILAAAGFGYGFAKLYGRAYGWLAGLALIAFSAFYLLTWQLRDRY